MNRLIFGILTLLACALASAPTLFAAYDPLAVDDYKSQPQDLVVKDAKRSREIPIRVYLPKGTIPAAVVLFSHGLGGSRAGSAFLGIHWAARGYAVVYVQHPGSDDSVWKNAPPGQKFAALSEAADLENFQLRVADIHAVLDQLDVWNKDTDDKNNTLASRLDLSRVGMSGHSFGAVTSQAVSGQNFPVVGQGLTDSRIKAAVMMSPSAPQKGDPADAFGAVKIPWMLLTGTNDNAPIGHSDAASRLKVFPVLPTGDKYELVLDKAEHSVFTERALPGDKQKRNPNHHRAILAVTTAFWDAYLNGNDEAKKWLESDDVRSVLEKEDRWQTK